MLAIQIQPFQYTDTTSIHKSYCIDELIKIIEQVVFGIFSAFNAFLACCHQIFTSNSVVTTLNQVSPSSKVFLDHFNIGKAKESLTPCLSRFGLMIHQETNHSKRWTGYCFGMCLELLYNLVEGISIKQCAQNLNYGAKPLAITLQYLYEGLVDFSNTKQPTISEDVKINISSIIYDQDKKPNNIYSELLVEYQEKKSTLSLREYMIQKLPFPISAKIYKFILIIELTYMKAHSNYIHSNYQEAARHLLFFQLGLTPLKTEKKSATKREFKDTLKNNHAYLLHSSNHTILVYNKEPDIYLFDPNAGLSKQTSDTLKKSLYSIFSNEDQITIDVFCI